MISSWEGFRTDIILDNLYFRASPDNSLHDIELISKFFLILMCEKFPD